MTGGRGTRLETTTEKPLFEVGGRPMVEAVIDALAASSIDRIHAAVSPHVPETRSFLDDRCDVIETPGEGYVSDLSAALDGRSRPVLTVAADLPLLKPELVDRIRENHDGKGSLTVCTPVALKRSLGVSVGHEREGFAPTGMNIVGETDDERIHVSYDARLAVNVNTLVDAAVAERLHPETGWTNTLGDGGGS